jgi:carboxyl-terminal processing protease
MQKVSPHVRSIIFAILFMVLGGVIGYRVEHQGGFHAVVSAPIQKYQLLNATQPSEYKQVDFQQFWEVWKILEQSYVDTDKIKADEMVYGAIKGMTASLGDPYTVYLPPKEQKRSEEGFQGSFYGVGIELGYIDNTLAVTSPLKDSPAEKAGVKAKDLILHVKDEKKGLDKDTQGWTLSEAVDNIRGDKGSPVILTLLRREGENKPFQVTINRDEIVIPAVTLKYLDYNGKKVAHIAIATFNDRTMPELNKTITDINAQSPKVSGIILDLRNNPGGYLDGAIDVASEFIKSGVIVTQKGKLVAKDYMSKGTGRLSNYPLVVTVNGGSASAAEIVAGALRDDKNAELIGEKTFGKGTVQDAIQLDNGAGLHVTIAKWLLPKGDWIHEKGIPVKTEVKDDPQTTQDEVIEKAKVELFQ